MAGAVGAAGLAGPPGSSQPSPDNGAIYFGVVVPRVTRDEWRAASADLKGSALSDEQLKRALDQYEQVIESLCKDTGEFCTQRRLRECSAELASGGSSAREFALKGCRECFTHFRTRTWPRADAALSETWSQLTRQVDRADPRAGTDADRAEAALRRRVALRHTSGNGGWDDLGQGVDFRSLFERTAREADSHTDFPALSRAICRAEQSGDNTNPAIATTAASVLKILVAHESDSAAQVAAYFQRWRDDAIRLPADGQSGIDFAQSRRARKIAASQTLAESTRRVIERIAHEIESGVGVEARGAWEDAAMGAAYPAAIQPETPTVAFNWILANVEGPATLDACRIVHRDYLTARSPIRLEAVDALMSAKCAGGPPPVGAPARARLDEIAKRRTELARIAVGDMRALLVPEDASRLQAFITSVQVAWDPSRPWGNI